MSWNGQPDFQHTGEVIGKKWKGWRGPQPQARTRALERPLTGWALVMGQLFALEFSFGSVLDNHPNRV